MVMTALKQRLYTPGPTTVPEDILQSMAGAVIHHRTPEFMDMFSRIHANLQYIFNTSYDIITLSASGTGAMEAAVLNILAPGDTALVIDNGKFSHRWYELCTTYGINTTALELPWGASPTAAALDALLAQSSTTVVFATLCETSTGALSDIEALGKIAKKHNCLFVVDAITGVGIHPLFPEAWGIDITVAGSQKGLMTPPGLSFAAVSPKAWDKMAQGSLPSHYFNLPRARKALHKNQTPFSPSSTLITALDRALVRIRTEGREQVWERHAQNAAAMRAGITALGFTTLPTLAGNVLTAVIIPPTIDTPKLIGDLLDIHGIRVAGGQGKLKDTIIRISNTGYSDYLDVITFLAAFENILSRTGWTYTPGAGIQAAQTQLLTTQETQP